MLPYFPKEHGAYKQHNNFWWSIIHAAKKIVLYEEFFIWEPFLARKTHRKSHESVPEMHYCLRSIHKSIAIPFYSYANAMKLLSVKKYVSAIEHLLIRKNPPKKCLKNASLL